MIPRHRPLDAQVHPRFSGIRTYMRLPALTDLDGVDVAVVGVPFDTTVSFRAGARFGPSAIREASVILRPYHTVFELDIFDAVSAVDYGDIAVVPGNTERSLEAIAAGLRPIVAAGAVPLVLGGDHLIALGEMRALAERHGPLALVQLDSHGDTWDSYFGGERYFHGTVFRRAVEEGLIATQHSIQAGMHGPGYSASDYGDAEALGFRVVAGEELRGIGPAGFAEEVRRRVGDHPAFLSFDIDFVDPAFAPATGTPEPGGRTSVEAIDFVRALAGTRLVGCDIVEVCPPYDGPGHPTAFLAARIAWEALALVALARSAQPVVGNPPHFSRT